MLKARGSPLLDRYLSPARVLPSSPRVFTNVLRTLRAIRNRELAPPPPPALGVDVSDLCNLSCAVCARTLARDARDRALLPIQQFRSLVEETRPSYVLISGSGEPLLHPELPELVTMARDQGAAVTVITNGTLLHTPTGQRLIRAAPGRLRVSIDAAKPDIYSRFRKGGDLPQVLENLQVATSAGITVELQFVLFRENLGELLPFVELCARTPGVRPIFLRQFTYGGQEAFLERSLRPLDHELPEVLATLRQARERCASAGFSRGRASLELIEEQLVRDFSRSPCYMPWYQVYLTTDGRLFPCCHHSIHGRALGRVTQGDFAQAWNSPEMKAFRRRLLQDRASDPVCARCGQQDLPLERTLHPRL